MKIMKVTKWVAMIFLLSIFAGCTTVDVREGAAPGVKVEEAGIKYNTAVIIDKSLQNWEAKNFNPSWSAAFGKKPKEMDRRAKITIESTDAKRTATGTLEVWAVIRNRTDYPLQIEGRAQFFDSAKAPIEGPTAWQRVYLAPQSVNTYKELSTKTNEINYYYIEIREGR